MIVGIDSCAAFIRICAGARINSCLQTIFVAVGSPDPTAILFPSGQGT